MSGDIIIILSTLIAMVLVVFFALPIHEFAHGWVAYKLGDHTAKNQGRLDLNPLRHYDLVGTTLLLLTGFGWAKPVPINPFFFKDRKKGMALTALAGPVANIILALITMIILKLLYFFPSFILSSYGNIFAQILLGMININIGLAVFNLIPIPPLDGSRIIGYFLPDHVNDWIYHNERFVMMGLFAAMIIGVFDKPIAILSRLIYNGIDFLTGFIDILIRLAA